MREIADKRGDSMARSAFEIRNTLKFPKAWGEKQGRRKSRTNKK